jgi:hypothetical protein
MMVLPSTSTNRLRHHVDVRCPGTSALANAHDEGRTACASRLSASGHFDSYHVVQYAHPFKTAVRVLITNVSPELDKPDVLTILEQ